MTTVPSLITIPELAVDIILKNVDFKGMFSLRKVCKSLRNYIDKRKPEVYLDTIEFSLTPDSKITVKLQCNLYKDLETREIVYSENPFVSLYRDFKIIMSHWKSTFLVTFRIELECENPDSTDINQQLIDCIRIIFLDRPNNQKLSVFIFQLQVTNELEVMELLQLVDPNACYAIGLAKSGELDLTEIRETEHWKRAAELHIASQLANLEPMAEFIGCSIVKLAVVRRIYLPQVFDVLRFFRDHDDIQEFSISFLHFPDRQLFFEEFREGTTEGDNIKWYVSFVNKDIFIEVKLSTLYVGSLSFNRIPDVEEGDVLFFGDEDEDEVEFDDDEEDEQENNE